MPGPRASRRHGLRVRLAAGVLGPGLVVAGVLGGEALVTLRRTYLAAESAPPVAGSFGAVGRPQLDLVMIGDSTAAGVGAAQTAGTVGGRLAAALAGESRRVRLTSVAVSGSRATDLGGQVTRALRSAPDLAVILIGANDATHGSRLSRVRRDVAAAVSRLRAAGVEVVVGTCPDMGAARAFPQPLRLLVAWQGRRVAAAEQAGAREAGAEAVDIGRATGPAMRADPATLASDDFHPSDRGYRLWAEALLPAVRDAAQEVASSG